MLNQLLQKRTIAIAGAALVLLVAAATGSAAAGVSDIARNVGGIFGGSSGTNGPAKVEVCHAPPGNPGNAHTITIGAPAVAAHLAHGDTEAACGESSPLEPTGAPGTANPTQTGTPATTTPTQTGTPATVTPTQTGTPATVTPTPTATAGTETGTPSVTATPSETPTPPETGTPSVTPTQTEESVQPESLGPSLSIEICHNGRTISVGQGGLENHLAHGDTAGPCPEE